MMRGVTRAAHRHPLAAEHLLRDASLELARLRRIRGAYWKTWRRIARAQARLACAAALLGTPLAEPAGAGTPIFVSPLPLRDVGYDATPAFVDVDGDGDLDAFVGEANGSSIFSENTGTANAHAFAAPSTNPFGLTDVGSRAAPAFADIDDDGDADIFIGEFGGNTVFRWNTGSAAAPAFAAPSTNPFGLADVGTRATPAFADVDGDGDLDAFVGASAGDTLFFQNTGSPAAPAFAAPSTNPFGLADAGAAAAPAFADVDGDGDLDAFVGANFSGTLFFRNTGTASTPAFAAASTNPFGLTRFDYPAPAFADIDADGDLDAFFGETGGATFLFANTGTTSAPAFSATRFGLPDVGFYASPDFADSDGDGDLDAFIADEYGRTIFAENTGSASAPAFGAPSTNPFGLPTTNYNHSPDFADIDGDGDLDLFSGYYLSTIFFENTGSTSLAAFAPLTFGPFGLTWLIDGPSPTLADIDGDGDFDACVGGRYGEAWVFENTGSPTLPAFTLVSSNPFGLADVGYWSTPTFADVDGDGDLDAWVGEGYGSTFYFQNTGTLAAPAFGPPTADPFGLVNLRARASPTFADIDGDGDGDALIGAIYGMVQVFENVAQGPGTCDDGIDNDFDGGADFGADPGCASAGDTNELSSLRCDNGLDDDHDGKIDWRGDATGDPQCVSLTDNFEAAPPPSGCGLGPELLLLGPLLAAMRRRRAEVAGRQEGGRFEAK
jgi:hypothetical protein